MSSQTQKLFAVTIFGYRKPGMDEDFYHDYVSQTHASHLKDLLVQNKIVSYHMQHNSTKEREMLDKLFPGIPSEKVDDSDCIVQIVFKSFEDYVNVRNSDHYKNVVNPDHDVFSDATKTKFVTGWFEFHVINGQAVI